MSSRKSWTAAVSVAVLPLLISACSVGGTSEAVTDANGRTEITVGHFPTSTTTLPLVVAQERGFFEEENLVVETVDAAGGPELTSALLGGTTQIAVGVPANVVPAMEQGSGIVGLPPYARLDLALAVPESSPITSLKQLEGRQVGVTQRGALTEKFASTLLRDNGVDSDAVTYLGVGNLAAYVASLRGGDVDAAVVTSDAAVVLAAQGVPLHVLAGAVQGSAGELSEFGIQSLYTTTTDFRDANPEALDAFCRSMASAVEWIKDESNGEEAGSIIAEVIGVDPAAGEKIWAAEREFWSMEITEQAWDFNVDWTMGGEGDVPFASSQMSDCG